MKSELLPVAMCTYIPHRGGTVFLNLCSDCEKRVFQVSIFHSIDKTFVLCRKDEIIISYEWLYIAFSHLGNSDQLQSRVRIRRLTNI